MKRKFVFSAAVLLFVQAAATANVLQVPSRTYPTIQSAITAAQNFDIVVVAPNPNPYYPVAYTGIGNNNLDFGGKSITVRSQINPANPDWNIINSTIIDCGGEPASGTDADGGRANRAFVFDNGEGNDARVIGFKIINGYARGPKGADGAPGFIGDVWRDEPTLGEPWQTETPAQGEDPCELPPVGLDGDDASGPGYGGAILCDGSSPVIQYCVFESCIVTGAHGGNGAPGISGPWANYTWTDFNWDDGNTYHQLADDAEAEENLNGQWGGDGNDGNGIGFGGAIACRFSSNPTISHCIFRNNSANGGQGGDGGRGGNAAYPPDFEDGDQGGGGNAGNSIGEGKGGAIYAASNCNPVIADCNFVNNVAKTGPRAEGGERGFGNEGDPPAQAGTDGRVSSSDYAGIAGGAVYFDSGANASFVNCNFIENKAYFAYENDPSLLTIPEDIAGYTFGGAIYFDGQTFPTITIDTCKFIDNSGGALFCGLNSDLHINNNFAAGIGQPGRKNIFQGNTAPYWGGAIIIDSGCGVEISNANFGGNRSGGDGGAIKSFSGINITNCAFSGNVAEGFNGDFTGYGYGGAIDCYSGLELDIYMNNCSFVGNESRWGGALSSEIFHATLENCVFTDNKAQMGGALDLGLGTVNIGLSVLRGNRATEGDGGAVNCRSTSAQIYNCEFFDNSARGFNAFGGAINFIGQANPNSHAVSSCLFSGNSSVLNGGAIACSGNVHPDILNSTFSENTADEFGGAVFIDYDSSAQITDCIIHKNNSHAIHEEDFTGNAITQFCLFFDNPDGHYYDSSTGLVYNNVNLIPGGFNNLEGDPLFVTGTLGNYYLSQINAGQGVNSPALNNGSNLASLFGLDVFTTRTDNVGDAGQVDIGYHFRKAVDVPTYQLTTSVVGGHGTVSPGGTYYAGTIATVTAQPNTGWVVKQWTGTEDDSERAITATVVMNSDRLVTVEFKQPRTFIVSVGGGTGLYPTIADAMHDANDGDIIVVYPGVYDMLPLQFNKSVEVRSQYPDNPDWVASTILEPLRAGPIIAFPEGINSGAVLNGFTIRNSTWFVNNLLPNGENPGENGSDIPGWYSCGGAILIGPQAGPIIKNCVIRDNSILGGFGGNGSNADDNHNAGRGGWGGWARGGAVYCSIRSYPKFINCQILNNQVVGGFGGWGGDYSATGGTANYGGNWSRSEWYNYDPRDIFYEWVQGDLWVRWTELAGEIPGPRGTIPASYWLDDYGFIVPGYFGDYRWYSGYGGGVFVNEGSEVTFENCIISGNLAEGGLSGLGGNIPGGRELPAPQFEIPAFGGGVYIAKNSIVTFADCTINNNTASDPNFDHSAAASDIGLGGQVDATYDPLNHFSFDPYLGHGGGVCAELGAEVTFVDCSFSSNRATVGGGMFGAEADLVVSDCEFVANQAYQGGAMFGQDGHISIVRSHFENNQAPDDPNEPEVSGEGGGLHFWSVIADIADTNIVRNNAEASGGGAFFGGSGLAQLKNCLLTENGAGTEGGAISASTFAQLNMSNCTVANNVVGEFGGGLSCSYSSYANILDSIIWGNTGQTGAQLALRSEDGSLPSAADVSYSDIGPSATDVNAIEHAPGLAITVTNDANVLASSILGTGIELAGQPQYTGAAGAAGTFTGGFAAGIGIESGIILTSGDANNALPPNTSDGITTDNDLPGDADLDLLLQERGGADVNTLDATILEIAFTTLGGNLFFNFVFASDEYNEFTNSAFNDVFGFFLDGVNIALIPGTTTPVAINNVNGGNPLGTNASNSQYFYNNDLSDGGPFFDIEYDGFTRVFTARALNVGIGTHTIRLAIADTSDRVLDSAVFIQAGSFSDEPTFGNPIFADDSSSLSGYEWSEGTGVWKPGSGSGNINSDPCFINGYFLSQVEAGQDATSPCVNTGSGEANAPSIGMDDYTTRTDSVRDAGIVDMGYHYSPFIPPQFLLTVTAIPVEGLSPAQQPVVLEPSPPSGLFDWFTPVTLRVSEEPNEYQVLWAGTDDDTVTENENTVRMTSDRIVTVTFVRNTAQLTVQVIGQGTVTPMGGSFRRGETVTLTASPAEGYRLRSWAGTDNDTSTALTNQVTMNADNKIVTVVFGLPAVWTVPGDFTTIQAAVSTAGAGDIISVSSGVYNTPGLIIDKEITVTSTNPDDPCVVAATVIDGNGIASIGVYFGPGTNERTVFNGITIANAGYGRIPADDGQDPGDNGGDGGLSYGGGMVIVGSPMIKNCVIRNCNISGGNAGNGAAADDTVNAGHGGWGGWARGAGIYIYSTASPTIINTNITNNTATGGNGGNGGDFAEDGGSAGNGGNWSDGTLWQTWGYVDDYRRYSGYGGGVYCEEFSSPTFIACNIMNNTALGGLSGIGGNAGDGVQIPMPDASFRIPSYGGGAYCGANSSVTFIDCNITGNEAPKPNTTYHLDPYLGHGGGIAFENTSYIRFENCNISDNNSAVGGGMYWSGGEPEIIDSNISGNVAYVGGGIYGTESSGLVENCTFSNNFAGVEPNGVDAVAGQGAAIFASSMSGSIVDSVFNSNTAGASGGGMYIFGIGDDQATIKNCLFLDNEAGRDGGGISVNWNAVTSVENCTFYNNGATGQYGVSGNTGFGGGLCCSYGANTSVIDSILWNNFAVFGPEIAVETGFEHNPICGSVNISYSDIRDGQAGVEVGSGCTLIWGAGNKSTDPMFVNPVGDDFHLKQIAAGQSTDSPCVNAGNDTATNLGLSFYTTRTDGVPDRTIVDMGYHYPILEPCRLADLEKDGVINLLDFARLAAKWLENDCGISNNYCQGADLTFDTLVGLDDLDVITDCWLERDTLSPLPDPSRWALVPEGIWPSSVKMRAVDTVDIWGLPVQYFFECASGGCHSSGWRSDANYTDTGLAQSVEYSYRVQARDAAGNTTGWSVVRSAVIGPDVTPPVPNPMTWRIPPRVLTPTSVEMAATTATDTAGGSVQYEFDETTGNPGATDSGWRNDPCYIDTGLTTSSSYCYRVRARDASNNITDWSTEICLGNLGDSTPPTPAPTFIISPDVNYVAAETYDTSGQFQFMEFPVDYRWWHKIVVSVAGIADDITLVEDLEVRFICLGDSGFSSVNNVSVPLTLGLGNVVLGSRTDGWRVTILGDIIVYDVDVDTYAVTGRTLNWMVCVYDEAGNSICTAVHTLGPPPL